MLPKVEGMYRDMAAKLGNTCRCETCGGVVTVDPARCLRSGWPKCCGATMTLLPKADTEGSQE